MSGNKSNFRYLLLVLVTIFLLIVLGGYLFFKSESSNVIKNQHQELEAIAQLKIDQIEQWRKERLAEAEFFSTRETVINKVESLINDKDDQSGKEYFLAMFDKFSQNHSYSNIYLVDRQMNVIWRLDPALDSISDNTRQNLMTVLKDSSIVFSDFYKDNARIYIDIVAPVLDNDRQIIAFLVFINNPAQFLFPLIQKWPTPSKSAETLILERQGDSVLFINELRHRANTAMNLKIPLTRKDVPAVQVVLGYRGIFEGIDYRGVKVLSDVKQVAGTNWFMVAKEDKREIYKELYTNGLFILVFVILSFLISVLILVGIYSNKQKKLYKKLFIQEKELRESEHRLRTTMDNMLEGCQIIGRDWRYLYVNEAVARQGKKEIAELLGFTMMEVYPGIENTELFQQLDRCMTGRTAHQMENEFIYPDGSRGWFELSIQPAPEGLFVLSIDITQRKDLERQLLHSMKMESLGTLAGGITHDFNNILGIIMGNIDLIPYYSDEPEKLIDSVNTIKQATQRGSEIIQQLLTFARKTEVHLMAVQINDIIRETVKLVQSSLPKNIEIISELEDTLPKILADQTQLQQVLINLCVNARDAMPEGGRIKITTAMGNTSELKERHPGARNVSYILVRVNDNGTGLEDEVLAKIFEPFFTTKEEGKGTGLGLSLVDSIVTNHHGFIEVYSHPGKGTEFHIYFPVPKE